MKIFRKIICALLALAFLLAAPTACGDSSGTSAPSSVQTTATAAKAPGKGTNTQTQNTLNVFFDGEKYSPLEIFLHSDTWSETENKLVHTESEFYKDRGSVSSHTAAQSYANNNSLEIPSLILDYDKHYYEKAPDIGFDISSNGTLTKVQFSNFTFSSFSGEEYRMVFENSPEGDIISEATEAVSSLHIGKWLTVFTVTWQGDYIESLGKHEEIATEYVFVIEIYARDHIDEVQLCLDTYLKENTFDIRKIYVDAYDNHGALVNFMGEKTSKVFYMDNADFVKLRNLKWDYCVYDPEDKSGFLNRLTKEDCEVLIRVIEAGKTELN
ncbi:MAG: hypothetical protein IJW21_05140 [Clostridia bacterium]|nr:hypothetical protein [Clostridia bacterium]